MKAHFPRRTSDRDGTAGFHTRRRTSYLSCFRSRTWCNASALPGKLSDRPFLYHPAPGRGSGPANSKSKLDPGYPADMDRGVANFTTSSSAASRLQPSWRRGDCESELKMEEHSQDHGVPGSKADSMTNVSHGAEESEFYSKNVRRK
jgi:hypothetical protein